MKKLLRTYVWLVFISCEILIIVVGMPDQDAYAMQRGDDLSQFHHEWIPCRIAWKRQNPREPAHHVRVKIMEQTSFIESLKGKGTRATMSTTKKNDEDLLKWRQNNQPFGNEYPRVVDERAYWNDPKQSWKIDEYEPFEDCRIRYPKGWETGFGAHSPVLQVDTENAVHLNTFILFAPKVEGGSVIGEPTQVQKWYRKPPTWLEEKLAQTQFNVDIGSLFVGFLGGVIGSVSTMRWSSMFRR